MHPLNISMWVAFTWIPPILFPIHCTFTETIVRSGIRLSWSSFSLSPPSALYSLCPDFEFIQDNSMFATLNE